MPASLAKYHSITHNSGNCPPNLLLFVICTGAGAHPSWYASRAGSRHYRISESQPRSSQGSLVTSTSHHAEPRPCKCIPEHAGVLWWPYCMSRSTNLEQQVRRQTESGSIHSQNCGTGSHCAASAVLYVGSHGVASVPSSTLLRRLKTKASILAARLLYLTITVQTRQAVESNVFCGFTDPVLQNAAKRSIHILSCCSKTSHSSPQQHVGIC